MAESAIIIFDIDGTLLQTDLITVPAVQRTFAAHGLPEPDAEVICSFFGEPVEDYLKWLASLCSPGQAVDLIEATNARELELIGEEGRLYPGVPEVLDTLKRDGHVLAICSNGPADYVNEFLDAHAVRPFFDRIRTPGAGTDEKATMLREILAAGPPRPAIVVGDRQDDVAAAHANRALAIAALYGFGSVDELRAADAHVSAAREIPAAVHALLDA